MRHALALCAVVSAAAGGIAAASSLPSGTVTIIAEPSIARWPDQVSVSGAVSPAAEGQDVTVQSKACGARSFSNAASTTTAQGGSWFVSVYIQGKTVFRATSGGVRSREVVVQARPRLVLGQISKRLFRAILDMGVSANGKRLVLQRFDPDDRVWLAVKTVVFRSSSTGWPQMSFKATVAKGTLLRLTLPRPQAHPCYLAGYSNLLQT